MAPCDDVGMGAHEAQVKCGSHVQSSAALLVRNVRHARLYICTHSIEWVLPCGDDHFPVVVACIVYLSKANSHISVCAYTDHANSHTYTDYDL